MRDVTELRPEEQILELAELRGTGLRSGTRYYVALQIQQHGDIRAHPPAVIDESRPNRLRLTAGNRLLEAEIRHQHADRRTQLLGPIGHELPKYRTTDTNGFAHPRIDIVLDHAKNGKQRNQLDRRHQEDGEHEHPLSETELTHSPQPRAARRGI